MRKWSLILALVAVVTSCKKEPLPDLPEANTPYYSVSGYVDGEFVDMNVGQEGIHISQGVSEMNGIPTFYGQIISPNENLRLRIEFTRPEIVVSSAGVSAFDLSNLGYLVHQPGCKTFSFGSNILQGNFVQVAVESGIFNQQNEISFDEYGKHEVSFKFTDIGQNSFTIPIKYGFENTMLNTGFTTSPNQDTTVFSANDIELNHEWYIDGTWVSSEAEFGMPLSIGIHKVEHKVKDTHENEASHTTLIRITDFVLDWQLGLNPCSGTSNSGSKYGKVIVTLWKDGVEYSSVHLNDNLSNNFSVSNIEYFGVQSMPSRAAFEFSFGTTLMNEDSGDSLSLSGMSGNFNIGLQ